MRSFATVLLGLALGAAAAGTQQNRSKPNVIYFLLDDLGSADVSFYSRLSLQDGEQPRMVTPKIDYLADSGITLKQFYTHDLCAPTRSALLTGRYATNLGNPFPFRGAPFAGSLNRRYKTIAEELATRGYRNYIVGKWGVDGGSGLREEMALGSGWGPTERGFHEFYGITDSGHNHYSKKGSFLPDAVPEMNRWTQGGPYLNESSGEDRVDPEPTVHSTTLFAREAVNYINGHVRDHPDEPFFMYWASTAPHDPLQSDESWMNHTSCRGIDNWRRKTYCGMVLGVDEGIGNITAVLEEQGILENTIIMFSSDNGGAAIVGGFNDPFRGGKVGAWEGSSRVAAFIRAPAHLGAGNKQVYEGMMHVVDWAPTVLSLIDGADDTKHDLLDDADGQGPIDGLDISLALRFNTASPRREALLTTDTIMNRSSFVMLQWKLVMGYPGEGLVNEPSEGHAFKANMDLLDRWDYAIREAIFFFLGIDFFFAEWMSWYLLLMIKGWTAPMWTSYSPRRRMSDELDTFPIEDVFPEPEWGTPRVWLFDLSVDPYEENNLAEGNEDIVRTLAARIQEVIKNAPPQGSAVGYVAERIIWFVAVGWAVVLLCCTCCCCCCCGCCRFCRNQPTELHPVQEQQGTELAEELVPDGAPSSKLA